MYLTHFGFTEPPFKTLLFQASKQRSYINYFAGVELMLAHACNDSDSIGLFGEDDIIISELLNRVQMKSETPGALIEVNNNLSAKEFEKKLADCLSFTDEILPVSRIICWFYMFGITSHLCTNVYYVSTSIKRGIGGRTSPFCWQAINRSQKC